MELNPFKPYQQFFQNLLKKVQKKVLNGLVKSFFFCNYFFFQNLFPYQIKNAKSDRAAIYNAIMRDKLDYSLVAINT